VVCEVALVVGLSVKQAEELEIPAPVAKKQFEQARPQF
jgi:hypothetical protein